MLIPQGACMAADFSLEKLSGFGDLLQHCTGLVRLEATGNDLTSLAGRPHYASAEYFSPVLCVSSGPVCPVLSCLVLQTTDITTALVLCCTCSVLLSTAVQ